MKIKNFSDKNNVLILKPRIQDADKLNDYVSFNAGCIEKYFTHCRTYNFYDQCINYGISYIETEIKDIIIRENISIIFFFPFGSSFELSPLFFAELKKIQKLKIVLFVLDDELIFDVFSKYYAQIADAAITCDYYAVALYEKFGIPAFYYFSSYSKDDFYPVACRKEYDVSFIGDCSKADRREYIDFLKNNNINISTFGKNSENGFIAKDKLGEIFSKSKINLNFTKTDRYEFPFTYNVWFNEDNLLAQNTRQNKGRPMEIGMTRSFCLTEYAPSLKYTFDIEKEIDVFFDKNDLLKKVRRYLQNELEREELASNLYLKANNIYSAENFFPKLMERLIVSLNAQKLFENERIYLDKNFKIKTINQVVYIFFIQLAGLKLSASIRTAEFFFVHGFQCFFRGFFKAIKRIIIKILSKFFKKAR